MAKFSRSTASQKVLVNHKETVYINTAMSISVGSEARKRRTQGARGDEAAHWRGSAERGAGTAGRSTAEKCWYLVVDSAA